MYIAEYEQISKNEESLQRNDSVVDNAMTNTMKSDSSVYVFLVQSSAISDQPLDLSKKAHNTSKNLSDMGKMNFGITTDNIRKSVPVQVYRAPQFGAQNFHPQRVQINSYGIGNSPRGNRKRHFVEERTSGVTANPVLAKFAAIGDQNINVDESRNFMG
ncbi:unnamed protein product [Thelazia callipaeda]|uniref:Reverse transcriptase domain-containing protein n=1 Tax=Thelazia callipaeda TaxID=103827 RepID=A0A0N5CPX3_THECL|nr:unnamed protein product [Thelazia callipaeda]